MFLVRTFLKETAEDDNVAERNQNHDYRLQKAPKMDFCIKLFGETTAGRLPKPMMGLE